MTDAEREFMKAAHEDWAAAKKIIERFLVEVGCGGTPAELDHNSSALVARLAAADPPLLVVRSSLVKGG